MPGTPGAFFSLILNAHWFLQSEVMGTFLTGTGTLGWGPGVGPAYSASLLLLPVSCGLCFILLVVGFLFSWIAGGTEW